MKVDLSLIRTDGGTQPRAGIDQAVVSEYAEALEAGDTFPPLTVFHDGAAYWLADGFHRFHALGKLGTLEAEADVRQGTRRDAVLHSVGANATHGLRRTNEDKRRAVTTLLQDAEWGRLSDREIGRLAGVSNNFASVLRRSLSSDDSQTTANRSQSTERRGADGRTINTANIGRPRADPPAPRHVTTYSPPVTPEQPEEDDRPEYQPPPRQMDLVTGEGVIRPDASLELLEIASQPVPTETPDTRMKAALRREGYDEAERVGKHLAALANYDGGRLAEIVNGPSGRLLGLPKLYGMVLVVFKSSATGKEAPYQAFIEI